MWTPAGEWGILLWPAEHPEAGTAHRVGGFDPMKDNEEDLTRQLAEMKRKFEESEKKKEETEAQLATEKAKQRLCKGESEQHHDGHDHVEWTKPVAPGCFRVV